MSVFKYSKNALGSEIQKQTRVPVRQVVNRLVQEIKPKVSRLKSSFPPQEVGTSALGTPVIDNLVIEAGSYEDLNGNQVDYPELRIDTVLINVAQDKNIIRTPVLGRNGTVKRYVSDGDFSISISGKLVNNENNQSPPSEDLASLIKILKSPEEVAFISAFLQEFEIFDVVIRAYELPQTSRQNEQPFEIRAFSDEPFDFIITGE